MSRRRSRRPAVLFRRGLSSAISGEESGELLRARRHRRVVPDRGRRQRLIFAVAASLSCLCERDAFPGDKNAFLTINAARLEHLF